MRKLLLSIILMSGLFAEPILKFYCGSTMAETMRTLADKFEVQNKVRIVVLKGESGKLYKRILSEKDGDLYLPGAQSYVIKDKNNLFSYKKLVGYNKAVILVQKGNPKGIRDLNDFTRNGIRVVLGNSQAGSVGKIAKQILITFRNIAYYNSIYKKAIKVPTSIGIINTIKNNKADVSINWKASAFANNNRNFVSFVNIPYIAPKQKLFLTVIKYSKYPKLSKKFVDFVFKNKLFLRTKGF